MTRASSRTRAGRRYPRAGSGAGDDEPRIVDLGNAGFDGLDGDGVTSVIAHVVGIGLRQLAVLAFPRLEPFSQFGGNPGGSAAVHLGFLDPLVQRVRPTANLLRDGNQRRPARRMLPLVLRTIRTALARTSGANPFVVLLMIAPSLRSWGLRQSRDGSNPQPGKRFNRSRA